MAGGGGERKHWNQTLRAEQKLDCVNSASHSMEDPKSPARPEGRLGQDCARVALQISLASQPLIPFLPPALARASACLPRLPSDLFMALGLALPPQATRHPAIRYPSLLMLSAGLHSQAVGAGQLRPPQDTQHHGPRMLGSGEVWAAPAYRVKSKPPGLAVSPLRWMPHQPPLHSWRPAPSPLVLRFLAPNL